MPTRRAATSLDVRPDDYELEWMIDLRYVLVNVVDIYEIYKQAIEKIMNYLKKIFVNILERKE